MAYINFKEERYKTELLLSKRKKYNLNLYKKLKENNKKVDDIYNKKYSYNIISNKTINTSDTLDEVEFTEIRDQNYFCTHFIKCKICNIKFINCKFIGCIFENCNFAGGGVIFENCIFMEETLRKKPSLNIKENLSCTFLNSNIYARFSNSIISYCIFENVNFKDTSFEVSDLSHVIMKSINFNKVEISDCNLRSIKILYPYMKDFKFNNKYKSTLDDKSFFDKLIIRHKTRSEYEGIYSIYEDIANEFNNNNLKNNFGEYYYWCKKTQRKVLKPFPKVSSYIYWITSGYGERILTPLVTSIIIMIIFAFIYMIFGVDFDGEIVKYITGQGLPGSITEFIAQYSEALNLSISIFVGLGTSNSFPTYSSNIFFDVEMIVGVIMLGIGIGTITRKLIR